LGKNTATMRKLGFGIVGTGAIAQKHAMAIRSLDEAVLLAVCSSTADRAAAAATQFGVAAYADLALFLEHEGLDVVCICTSSGNHLQPALAAAAKGKHLLIEKPIEINMHRAGQIIAACEENDVKLGVIFQNRFNKAYQELKSAVEKGLFGKLLMGNAAINWFRDIAYYQSSPWKGTLEGDGGGAVINQGIHTLDLLLDLMGAADTVSAQVQTAFHQIEGEDLSAAIVKFKSGALGTISAATCLFPGYPERLEIFGTEGSAVLAGGELSSYTFKYGDRPFSESSNKKTSGASDPMAIGHQLHAAQIKDMVEAIRYNRKPEVDGYAGIKSIQLIEAIYSSSKSGGAVMHLADFL
jgi:UDP-N-acetyl-2-amino-2-deoxyglucuronate dehydrogenase